MLTIVPKGVALEAQLFGPSSAIGFMRAGQRVMLRYQAYPVPEVRPLRGAVASVSRSAISPGELPQQLAGLTSLVWRATSRSTGSPSTLASQTVRAYGEPVPLAAGHAARSRHRDGAPAPDRVGPRPALHPDRDGGGDESRPRASSFGWGRRLPMVLQTEAAECGLACLAMVAGYSRLSRRPRATLRRRFGLSLKGATPQGPGAHRRPARLRVAPAAARARRAAHAEAALHPALGPQPLRRAEERHGAAASSSTIPASACGGCPARRCRSHFTGIALELTPAGGFQPATAAAARPPPRAGRQPGRPRSARSASCLRSRWRSRCSPWSARSSCSGWSTRRW